MTLCELAGRGGLSPNATRYSMGIGGKALHYSAEQMITTINGRNFEITENTSDYASLRKHLVSKGFDGTIWMGFSARTGRQKKDLHSMIYRKPSGEYVIAASV